MFIFILPLFFVAQRKDFLWKRQAPCAPGACCAPGTFPPLKGSCRTQSGPARGCSLLPKPTSQGNSGEACSRASPAPGNRATITRYPPAGQKIAALPPSTVVHHPSSDGLESPSCKLRSAVCGPRSILRSAVRRPYSFIRSPFVDGSPYRVGCFCLTGYQRGWNLYSPFSSASH
jgi:hypothetical protein